MTLPHVHCSVRVVTDENWMTGRHTPKEHSRKRGQRVDEMTPVFML